MSREEHQPKQSEQKDDTDVVGLDVFSEASTRDMFRKLCNRYNIPTNELDIVSVVLSLDSKYALAIVQSQSEPEQDQFELRAYDVETMEKTPSWHVEYKGKYIMMKHIDQTNDASLYALPYQDNGTYYVSVLLGNDYEEIKELDLIKKRDQSSNQREIKKINCNKILSIDKKSIPIDGILDPLITCCFTSSTTLFVSTYHRMQRRQYNFTYSIKDGKHTKAFFVDV